MEGEDLKKIDDGRRGSMISDNSKLADPKHLKQSKSVESECSRDSRRKNSKDLKDWK